MMEEKSMREQAEDIRRELAVMDLARRTRANLCDEAASVLSRLHHLAEDDDQRALFTLAELKVLGAAEETLREIMRRLL